MATVISIVDAAGGFLERCRRLNGAGEMLALWEAWYGESFPELYTKQVDDYTSAGQDWRQIALSRVFPFLPERMARMEAARERIGALWVDVLARARTTIGLETHIQGVVHVGIGCGAGWVTTYDGRPACLLGLENIAELGWHTEERLRGLLAHELGHVAHSVCRGESLEHIESDPIGLLYTEGVAQRMEGLILAQESWHLAPDEDWLPWCRRHLQDIAQGYLERAQRDGEVSPFFGSWYSYRGIPFTGYYLDVRQRVLTRIVVGRKWTRKSLKIPAATTAATARTAKSCHPSIAASFT